MTEQEHILKFKELKEKNIFVDEKIISEYKEDLLNLIQEKLRDIYIIRRVLKKNREIKS